jgi:hypothetical protein
MIGWIATALTTVLIGVVTGWLSPGGLFPDAESEAQRAAPPNEPFTVAMSRVSTQCNYLDWLARVIQ